MQKAIKISRVGKQPGQPDSGYVGWSRAQVYKDVKAGLLQTFQHQGVMYTRPEWIDSYVDRVATNEQAA